MSPDSHSIVDKGEIKQQAAEWVSLPHASRDSERVTQDPVDHDARECAAVQELNRPHEQFWEAELA